MNTTCENAEKCPIFNGILRGKEFTQQAYRIQYCEAGEVGWKSCKRYQAKEAYGVCPPNLLPNSGLSLQGDAEKYGLSSPAA
jgi:hypothetical protein